MRKVHSPIVIAVLCAIFLVALTAVVWTGLTEKFDRAWRQTAFDVDPAGALSVWKSVTLLGSGFVITLGTLGFIFALALSRRWQDARYVALVMVAAVIVENAMKWIVQRPRPDEVIAYAMPSSFSFPSGHTLFATAFYGACALIVSPWLTGWARALMWFAVAGLVFAIGGSRIFLGVHYPSDVIAGFLAGALCVATMRQTNKLKVTSAVENS